ncbi:hypothetical protein APHAL10511_006560 [Amanita phalloides]|nr:hypothetical protein APHAL10511_006560 [Amanita phalloides]
MLRSRLHTHALRIAHSPAPRPIPPASSLVFGHTFTDHMLTIPWSLSKGWGTPEIKPYGPLALEPSTSVLHYAQTIFEGMKAYRSDSGRILLFRPDMNMKRMNVSAQRIALPTFDGNSLLHLIKELIRIDKHWIPKEPDHSLYVRPTMIGTQRTIGVCPPTEALLFVICSPVGPYYPNGFKPVSLFGTTEYIRAAPGGTGAYKLGVNYAPGIMPQQKAAELGYTQNLWLHGPEHYLTEVGTMNMFVVFRKDDGTLELVTPPLDGMILPGVTRDSVLALARDHASGNLRLSALPDRFVVTERPVQMSEIKTAATTGSLVELFGAGTAAVISPVNRVGYLGEDIHIPTGDGGMGIVARTMWKELVGRQTGAIPSDWSVVPMLTNACSFAWSALFISVHSSSMIFDPATAPQLKPWLLRTLEPICDAEPGALADYILALLKHNVPENEMRKELAVQLDEFLENECASFIDTLFTVLRTKSYVPYAPAPPSPPHDAKQLDTGIPIPLDGLISPSIPTPPDSRPRKRSIESDDRDSRPPAKGPRLNSDSQFSRYNTNGRQDAQSSGGWGDRGDSRPQANYRDGVSDVYRNGSHTNGRHQQPYAPSDLKRGICRDYHNYGYCARGALCKFSHGDDAVVPGQFFPPMGAAMPFLPMFGNGAFNPATAYDPHEARMDMRPMGGPMGAMNGFPPMGMNMDVDLTGPIDVNMSTRSGSYRGGRPHSGRGRGTFSGEVHNFRPERHNGTTLVVEKIPQDKLSLEHVNDWFKRFGTVTNVAIDTTNAKALVSFSMHDEAHAAWKSEDAVFGNRFVKVFWHRPMEGHGQVGARLLAASAPLVAGMQIKETGTTAPPAPSPSPTKAQPARKRTTSTTPTTSTSSALAAKQKLLEQGIAEQKLLMAQLETASATEKKGIMVRLRKLGEEMKKPAETTGGPTSAGAPSTPTLPAPSSITRSASTPTDDRERLMRERLDRELEMHNATVAATGENGAGGTSGETLEDLKAKLDHLKAEAASLGIAEGGSSTDGHAGAGGGHRGGWYRGSRTSRGARSYYRGATTRGGHARSSMKLDNRPRKLLVKGAKEEHVQAVREWYNNAAGQVDSVETTESGDMVVAFRSRPAAEQGLAKGTKIADVGTVQLTWYTGTTTAPDTVMTSPVVHPSSQSNVHLSRSHHEEEVVASGWGGGEDDGDGMGLF